MKKEKSKTIPPSPPVKGEGMFLETEGRIFQACKDFRQFVTERTGKRYTDHILQRRWRTVAEAFIQQQLKGDQHHFLTMLNWYMQNIDGEYIPECLSIPRFCEKFRQLEKARSRNLSDTNPADSPPVTTIMHQPTIIKGTKCKSEDTW